ncbi:NRDE family protein [Novosphingobium huizhouense]|uniref:NRDE family protein n=1 Tax=Novosphingobium huizhouense TaxID=2866625 RepID=UPI001CD82E1E|nr:NRDE family protein [Novosphingobium huizhouense]
MCVAALAWDAHPRWRLVVIGNRDEFHDRAAAPLARWDDGTIAGRDLLAGGTWLGANAAGRLALVTNYRVEGYPRPGAPSRGSLVTDWLAGRAPGDIAAMNPFHLIEASPEGAWHRSNYPAPVRTALASGIHGLSNGGFDDRWAKTLRLEAVLADWLASGSDAIAPLLAALRDETPLPPPPSGAGPLPGFSPVFIANPVYGTRCSSVFLLDREGAGTAFERSFDAGGAATGEVEIRFRAQK